MHVHIQLLQRNMLFVVYNWPARSPDLSPIEHIWAESGFLGVNFFLLFRHKISEFRINCFKFTQYFAKISELIIIIISESFVTNANK